jgi:cysteine synthase A
MEGTRVGRGRVTNVLGLIGGTPLVQLNRIVPSGHATVLAKIEGYNPGGSVKDRICLAMIEDAEARGVLKPGATIIEPTSGNTGIGLAMIGAVKGYRVILTMPETMSGERLYILRSYGAEVILTPAEEGMIGAVRKAEQMRATIPDAFMPMQFRNPANPQMHRRTTAVEIISATEGKLDAFVAGIGTGGTITGVGEVLKQRLPSVRIVGIEPAGSPVLSGGREGPHLIQGIGAGFVPEVLNRAIIDEVMQVTDEEAYAMARRLAREEGLFVGLSAGAAAMAALRVASSLGAGKTVVVIFPDQGERYGSAEVLFQDRILVRDAASGR